MGTDDDGRSAHRSSPIRRRVPTRTSSGHADDGHSTLGLGIAPGHHRRTCRGCGHREVPAQVGAQHPGTPGPEGTEHLGGGVPVVVPGSHTDQRHPGTHGGEELLRGVAGPILAPATIIR